jgi:transcriptional regulator with PAS, ATPase and Fis domain
LGTLFLDEVTEMAFTLQAKLLRAIEERMVRPLGDTKSHSVDIRVISTSNRDIKSFIQQGRFREDLYYRLKVIDVELPPLRERKEDISLLVQHFIGKFNAEMNKRTSGVSEPALRVLMNHPWPGNVRELENVIQRAVTLSQQETILPEDLPSSMLEPHEENLMDKILRENLSLDQLEKEYIRRILIQTGGNKSKAAEILGLDRKTLYRKIQETE